ncbi:MAG: DNA repair protein RecO [Deltaproteobacteria bacterium HGW-Deltaproteobacteria-13]|jgi:DNA repair protein RecO (recombination protein O)|nr:MAG: DNA repair protein RecO [Deltaproteobacteria bacterium HGW-Deltaproteobacteria-13]
MAVRESYKTTGFVLRTLSYGESDLIVTFYSHDFGKLKGIAKGAKRSKKRFANVFEPFSLTNIIFTRKSRDMLAFIESCDIIDHYHAIRQDMEKTLIASYFIDLTDHFSPEGKKNEKVFQLLRDFLLMLGKEKASDATVRFFEMRLLKLTGFEPALEHCIVCKTPVTNGNSYYFHAGEGGIKCSACAQPQRYEQPISAGTVRTLLLGKDMDIEKIKLIALTDSLAAESRSILIGFIAHVLGREVKSLKVMEQVRKLCT